MASKFPRTSFAVSHRKMVLFPCIMFTCNVCLFTLVIFFFTKTALSVFAVEELHWVDYACSEVFLPFVTEIK